MSASYRELVRAVREAGGDMGPRLVLADWLQERGDARGELVVTQCRLASRGLDPATRGRLQKRALRLLEEHRDTWLAPAHALGARPCARPRGQRSGRGHDEWFRLGFLHAIACPIEPLLEGWQALLEAEPIAHLELEGVTSQSAERLAGSGILSYITHLTIRGRIGDEGVAALAEAPDLGHLERLNLKSVGMTDHGLSRLLEAPDFRPTRLALTDNELTDLGASALADSPAAGRLECLYLSRTRIGDAGVAALAGSPHLSRLARLALGALEELTGEGARALVESTRLPALRCLEVEQCYELEHGDVEALRARFGRVRGS